MIRKKKSSIVGQAGSVQCLITDRGVIVTEEVLKQYQVDSKTKQLEDVDWKTSDVMAPPYDLMKLMDWMNINIVHSSCVRTKVQDTVGIGYYLEQTDDKQNLDTPEGNTEYKALTDFFNHVNSKNEDILHVLKKVMLDYEGCGNGYLEVSRDAKNVINGLYHVNATTLRWSKEKDRLLQKVGNNSVWFKVYGEERILNRFTGKWEEQGLPDIDKIANEIIPVRQYSWLSSCYGVPEWLPALFSMYADKMEREYNIDFFVNFGVPAYALIVEGQGLSPEVTEEVEKFFATTLKGSNHKMLTLSTPVGTTIKFERLSVEQKEASFRVYKKDNRDDVLTAHHVPPYRAAMVEQGSLGGNVAKETDSIYLDSVINPRQRDFTWVLNELIIRRGFEIQDWQFVFEDINVSNSSEEATINNSYIEHGVLSPNEVRQSLGREPYEGGDVYYVSSGLVPVGGDDMDSLYSTEAVAEEGLSPEQKRGDVEIDL
jgi:PBSX family phage portal protein